MARRSQFQIGKGIGGLAGRAQSMPVRGVPKTPPGSSTGGAGGGNPPSFSPNSVSNLVLWLSADSGVSLSGIDVTAWADRSSSGNDAASAGSDPSLLASEQNGLAMIEFDGTEALTLGQPANLIFDASIPSAYEVFTVIKDPVLTGVYFSRNAGSSGAFQFALLGNPFNTSFISYGGTSAFGPTDGLSTSGTFLISNRAPANTNEIISRVDGVAGPGVAHGSGNAAGIDVLIGARRVSGNTGIGLPYDGKIGEIVAYNRLLTDQERADVESYLNNKWGI